MEDSRIWDGRRCARTPPSPYRVGLLLHQTGGDYQPISYDDSIESLSSWDGESVAVDVLDDSQILGGFTKADKTDQLFLASSLSFDTIERKDPNDVKLYQLSYTVNANDITVKIMTDDVTQKP